MQFVLKPLKCKIKGLFAVVAVALGVIKTANGQENVTLHIGDAAPALSYSKWIQGPVKIAKIDNDKIYVFEFWATWCGPCIQAMPHLSELSKKYKGKVTIVGCDVWENQHGGEQNQEKYLPKVAGFVKDQYKLGRLTYNVIADNTKEDMGNNWLKAAGIQGIPTTFVIQNGQIAWIGHPYYIDSILRAVVAGNFDVAASKRKYEEKEEEGAKMMAGPTAIVKKYKAAEDQGKYDDALALMDSAIIKYPDLRYMFTSDRFMLLMDHYSDEKAIAYGNELAKDNLLGQVLVGNLMMNEHLSEAVNDFAIKTITSWHKNDNPKVLDILAGFQARGQYYKQAAESEREAARLAKVLKDDPHWQGVFTETAIAEFQKKAEEYQAKAGN